jgi:hypothetical protein
MKEHYDPWFVRLPDGRTIKAKSTASVRHHVEAGHIPLNSMVRRTPDEEWVALAWVAEFADFASPHARTVFAPGTPPADATPSGERSGVSARLDPMRLQTVGIRGLVEELIAALDSTLSRSKLVPAAMAGVLVYLGFFVSKALLDWLVQPAAWVPVAAGTAFAILVLSILNAVLARLTHQELSTLRPARLSEAAGVVGAAVPAFLANALIAGAALGFLFLMVRVPGWAQSALADAGMGGTTQEIVFTPILVVVTVLSLLAWLLVGMCWLLTPAIVIEEEGSWLAGLREWRHLLREHFSRIVFYEGLTVLLGIAISLPLTLAVGLALHGYPAVSPSWPVGVGAGGNWVTGSVDAVLHGLSAAPLLALMGVANVFIYLNLRYEQGK